MPDSTLAALTAATAGTGGLFYGTQSGADRKFTMTAAGAALAEAANAAAQRTALGVSTISTPSIYYVQTTGNDSTAEIGNPAKPYLTAQAAYDAGVGNAAPFVLELGVGSFSISNGGGATPISSLLKSANGKGYSADDPDASATTLAIYAIRTTVDNGNGNAAPANPPLHADNLYLVYQADGSNVNCNDEIGGYTAGAGGTVHVIGDALWTLSAQGGNFIGTNGEAGNGGSPGTIIVEGGIIYTLICRDGAGYNAGIVDPSVSGPITLRHVDAARDNVIWPTVSQGAVTAGCSSLPVAVTPVNDKGGNAAW